MKSFRFRAHATLEAENVESALMLLGEYFDSLSRGYDPETLFTSGGALLKPDTACGPPCCCEGLEHYSTCSKYVEGF